MLQTISRKMIVLAAVLALSGLVSTGAWAQQGQMGDVYKIDYFSSANIQGVTDGTVRIANPGVGGATIAGSRHQWTCAMIYVFNFDQQLDECCACPVSFNGLRTLSINNDLASNSLTGQRSETGLLKVISAEPNVSPRNAFGVPRNPCEPAADYTPTPTLRLWATHVQNPDGTAGAVSVTEDTFQSVSLTSDEFSRLRRLCDFAEKQGSGQGTCTCGRGENP